MADSETRVRLQPFTVVCPNCSQLVDVAVESEPIAVYVENRLHVRLVPRFEHRCPDPPEREAIA